MGPNAARTAPSNIADVEKHNGACPRRAPTLARQPEASCSKKQRRSAMISDVKLRVLVAHNEPLLAAGLEAALRDTNEFEVLTSAPCCLENLAGDTHDRIDVVLSDCKTGVHFARQMRSRRRPVTGQRVVIVTQDDSETSIRHAMEAGVKGYLLQSVTTRDSVVQAVRSAARDRITLDPIAATRIADSLMGETLTDRELEVLQVVAQGLTDKVIAARLGISVGTTKCHVKRVLVKLGAATRTQAAAIAQRRGLVRLGVPLAPAEPGFAIRHDATAHIHERRSY